MPRVIVNARPVNLAVTSGTIQRPIYDVARTTILDWRCFAQVMQVPDNVPRLLGHIALEKLDLVADTKSSKVIPNPESGGKFTLDLL
jgi:hypothetical protein